MKILKFKNIHFLLITLMTVSLLLTSCSKDIIIEEDIDGVSPQIESQQIVNQESSNFSINLKEGDEKIYLKPKLLKEYTDFLLGTEKLSKEELIRTVIEVTFEDLERCFSGKQLDDDIIIFPKNARIPQSGQQPCGYKINTTGDPDNPVYDLNMDCACRSYNYMLYLDLYNSDASCLEIAQAQCNFNITAANCGNGVGTFDDCNEYYDNCDNDGPIDGPIGGGPVISTEAVK